MPGRGRDGNTDSSRSGRGQIQKKDVAYDYPFPRTTDAEDKKMGGAKQDRPIGG